MLSVQKKTNTLRAVNKQTNSFVEQRQTEIPKLLVLCFWEKAKLMPSILKWNRNFKSFKIVSWNEDIFGTFCCALRGGWHGRRECLGFAEKEIEKKQNTRSPISWNNSCDRNGELQGSRNREWFSSWSKEKERQLSQVYSKCAFV